MTNTASEPRRARLPGVFWIVLGGGFVLLLTIGGRQGFGLYQLPIVEATGWGREVFSIALAVQNLVWGLTEPLFGRLADRYGSRPVVIGSAGLWFVGFWLMSEPSSQGVFYLGAGVFIGMALAGSAFGVILGAVGRAAPPHRRGLALGIASAFGSVGYVVMVGVNYALIDWGGWSQALLIMGFSMLSLALCALLLGRRDGAEPLDAHGVVDTQNWNAALREAFGHRSYWVLMAGFFICGFQITFIGTHVVAYIQDIGLSPFMGSLTLTMIGVGNLVGSFVFSALGDRYRKKYLLCIMYLGRAVCILALLALPPSSLLAITFGFVIGVFWIGVIPLTTSLMVHIFGVRNMSMLFGFIYFSHQIGAALGVWLGGFVFDATGSFNIVWLVAAALGVLGAAIYWPMADRPVPRMMAPAGAPVTTR